MSEERQTEAGKQAAADKEAAMALAAEQAKTDQAAAAKAERQARAARNSARMPEIDKAPCEECAANTARIEQLEDRVAAIGKLVVTGIIAGAVLWFLSGSSRDDRRPAAAVEE